MTFVSDNFLEIQKCLFRINKKYTAELRVNSIYSRMRFCKIVLGVLILYVACDGSLLKRLTLFKFSFQRTVLPMIRRNRKRKRRRARGYFMTAFLCRENRCCEKNRLFNWKLFIIAARVFLHFALAKLQHMRLDNV